MQLCPDDLRVHPPAKAAIRPRNDVLAPDGVRVCKDAVGNQLGVLHDVGRVADDAGDEDLAFRQLELCAKA